MLQYALLHLSGYDLSMDDLKAFRVRADYVKPAHLILLSERIAYRQ